MTSVTITVISLGSYSELDTNESIVGAENAASLVGVSFGSAISPLAQNNLEPLIINDGNSDGTMSFGNHTASPTEYVTVVAVNYAIDIGLRYTATVTYMDGTSATSISVRIIQDGAGNLYFLPPPYDASPAEIDALTTKAIQSIMLTSVLQNDYTALNSNRYALVPAPTFICFARGTMIETDCGPIAIEELQRCDRVETMDCGFQTIRWIASRRLDAAELQANPNLRPIRIRAGALGHGLPYDDLLVSPQHRVLVVSKIALRMFGCSEILVAAKQLLLIDGIDVATDVDEVEYFHFLCNRHQIVFAQGAPTESLFTGIEALKAVSPEAQREIFEILPELGALTAENLPEPVRPIFAGRLVRKLAARHAQNAVSLIADV